MAFISRLNSLHKMVNLLGFPLETVYVLAGLVAMLLLTYSPFSQLLKHGRSVKAANKDIFYVSKNNFKYFYMIGVVCGLITILMSKTDNLAILFMIHLLRRYFETVHLFQSGTKMHILHLFIGITYYPIVWLVLSNPAPIDWSLSLPLSVAFLALNYLQFECHLALSRNADKSKLPSSTRLLFYRVACPNFLCEVLLYLVVAMWMRTLVSVLLLVFVGANQIISAVDRLDCYPEYRKRGWSAIVPG